MAQVPPLDFSPPPPQSTTSSPSPSTTQPKPQQIYSPPSLSPQVAYNNSCPLPPYQSDFTQSPQASDHINGDFEIAPKQQGAMGPPSKPPVLNAANLTDVLEASGINIAEEENYMFQTLNPNASFNSAHSAISGTQTLSAGNSFTELGQLTNGVNSAYFSQSGYLSAIPAPTLSIDDLALEEQRRVARQHAEKLQFHLNNPFLEGYFLRSKLHSVSGNLNIRLPNHDLQNSEYQHSSKNQSLTIQGADGSLITTAKPDLILSKESLLGDIIALLSIATNERLRDLTDAALAVSRGRQTYAKGEIPAEWKDIAQNAAHQAVVADGPQAGPENAAGEGGVSKKRRLEDSTPSTSRSASSVRIYQTKDTGGEESRYRKRARRNNLNTSDSPSTPATPSGILGDKAPEVEPKKLTKKEQAKAASARRDDVNQARHANATLSHVFGGKKKGKTYSWLTAASSSTASPMPGNTSKSAMYASNAAGSGGAGFTGGSGAASPAGSGRNAKRFGDWVENGTAIGAKGVHLRDWIAALELDGRAAKPLAKALTKLSL
ncbi:MAG: hypothetical protein M1814_000429 [Vezdaea aestivalis]|nr:MAG: hypothetical protein M1814_000429 [Vezdaea aestivalis]